MKKIIIVGIIAFLISALGYAVYQKTKESEENEDDVFTDLNSKKRTSAIFNSLEKFSYYVKIDHVKILNVKYLISKVKNMMAKKNVKKVAVMELEKLIEECPNQTSLAELEDEGVDAIFASVDFASVDEYGNVVDVECVSADIIDPSFQEKLGDEGMLVINR